MGIKVLYLTLTKCYFDAILDGTKKVEFREIKPYWTKRLEGKTFDVIVFKNGYSKTSPTMRVEWLGMDKGEALYSIKLGKILDVN